ncbi:hypothetical protein V5799_018489 [Amblyomma americanum]|uniref:Uncharacterized protein n=1 Tax=Amblyomma americanum TaxID=6943 RepID=A0AAQ4F079_AMBAM
MKECRVACGRECCFNAYVASDAPLSAAGISVVCQGKNPATTSCPRWPPFSRRDSIVSRGSPLGIGQRQKSRTKDDTVTANHSVKAAVPSASGGNQATAPAPSPSGPSRVSFEQALQQGGAASQQPQPTATARPLPRSAALSPPWRTARSPAARDPATGPPPPPLVPPT